MDAGEEGLIEVDVGEFVIAGGDAAHSLDASEVAFDCVAGAVGDAVGEQLRLTRYGAEPLQQPTPQGSAGLRRRSSSLVCDSPRKVSPMAVIRSRHSH